MIKKQLETEKDLNVTQEVRGLAARPASARLLEAARQTPQEVFAAYETTPQGQPRPDIILLEKDVMVLELSLIHI